MKLVLIRHGESEWNKLNLFTGWTDVDLSEKGREEARQAGIVLKNEGYDFDVCYTSYLKRAIHTLNIALDEMDRAWLPVVKSWKLNERHYGALQGLNKAETAEKYGEEQVKIWRRSYDVKPPALDESDERSAIRQPMFRNVDPALLPANESLETTVERVVPYFEEVIKPDMKAGKRVVIAAHGNSAGVRIRRRFQRDQALLPGRPERHPGQDAGGCQPGQKEIIALRAKHGVRKRRRVRVSTKSTPCHRKPAKAVFRWVHQFSVKWHFWAGMPRNAHFTAEN